MNKITLYLDNFTNLGDSTWQLFWGATTSNHCVLLSSHQFISYISIDIYLTRRFSLAPFQRGDRIYPIKLLTSRTGIDLNKVGPGGNHTWHTLEKYNSRVLFVRRCYPLNPMIIVPILTLNWPLWYISTLILGWNELSVSSWIWPTNQLQYMTLSCEWFFPLAFNIGICSWRLFCNNMHIPTSTELA